MESRTETAPQGSDRFGAIVGWGFGVAWAAWGVSGVADSTARLVAIVVAAGLGIAALFVVLRGDLRGVQRPRQMPADWRRRYNLLILVEVVAIFLASFALGRAGLPGLIPVAVCLIVGVHFYPLAGVFDLKAYRWTAVGLCAVGVTGAALFAVVSAGTVRAAVGFSAAIVLWGTAVAIILGYQSDSRSPVAA